MVIWCAHATRSVSLDSLFGVILARVLSVLLFFEDYFEGVRPKMGDLRLRL